MDTALVQAAEREQVLKLTAVRRLRALALFVEWLEDLVALAAAVLLAGTKLGRQAGFSDARELFQDPTGFYRVFLYDR